MNNLLQSTADSAISLNLEDIERIPLFGKILPTMEGLEDIVVKQIRRDGGYKLAPVVVGVISGDSDAHVLLDGYEVVRAAELAGFTELPAIRLVMPDRLSALKIAIQLNCNQQMDGLRFRIVKMMLTIFRDYPEYRPRYGTGRQTDHIAAAIGTSPRQVQRISRILEAENAEELIELIGTGALSVSAAERLVIRGNEPGSESPILF